MSIVLLPVVNDMTCYFIIIEIDTRNILQMVYNKVSSEEKSIFYKHCDVRLK